MTAPLPVTADEPPVLVTRSRADNARLAAMLRARGIPVLAWPTTRVRLVSPCATRTALRAGLQAAEVVVLTSRRGVLSLRALLGRSVGAALAGRRVAAVGASTAEALRRLGAQPAWIGTAGAEELGRTLAAQLAPGTRVLLVRGEAADEAPAEALRAAGLLVDDRRVYVHDAPPAPRCAPRPLAAVACASPSAARRALGWHPWIAAFPFVAIGPTTATALRDLGVSRVSTARRPTPEALCEAIATIVQGSP